MLLLLPLPGPVAPQVAVEATLLSGPEPLQKGHYIPATALEILEEAAAGATVLVPSGIRRRQLAVDLLGVASGSRLAFFPEVGGLHPPPGLGLFCGLALVGMPLARFRCFSATLVAFDAYPVSLLHSAPLLQGLGGGSNNPRLLWLSAGEGCSPLQRAIISLHLIPARRCCLFVGLPNQ